MTLTLTPTVFASLEGEFRSFAPVETQGFLRDTVTPVLDEQEVFRAHREVRCDLCEAKLSSERAHPRTSHPGVVRVCGDVLVRLVK